MSLDTATIVPVLSVVVSGLLGFFSLWLAFRKRSDEDDLARASRRTTALQLLSDEEFALIRVRDECISIQSLVEAGRATLGSNYEHLANEAARIVAESKELIRTVQEKRRTIEPQIQTLRAAEIEAVIAAAYHGRRRAEAQLQRTQLSRIDTTRIYGL